MALTRQALVALYNRILEIPGVGQIAGRLPLVLEHQRRPLKQLSRRQARPKRSELRIPFQGLPQGLVGKPGVNRHRRCPILPAW